MITHIHIHNYRSFVDAEVQLRPFSLVLGANGAGKSNLLRFFSAVAFQVENTKSSDRYLGNSSSWPKHQNHLNSIFGFKITFSDGTNLNCAVNRTNDSQYIAGVATLPWNTISCPVFNIDSSKVSAIESAVPNPWVKGDGSGTTQVLDWLKNGDREDLFDKIENNFCRYVPEVEKLSLSTVQEGKKQIQVREKGLNKPLLATELSEGTRIILSILTIIHQEKPPKLILLEDIDRGLHPRLFEYIAPLMKDIAEKNGVNIIATTHNPYLVDCFQDDKEAVIIVEKKDGASTLSTLASKLEGLDYDKIDPEDMPLGNLWFSGLIGGVPAKINPRPQK